MIHIVIMASGFSRRMGQDKLLADLRGKPVIQWVIDAACKTSEGSVTVIYRDPRILEIAEAFGISAIYNPSASQGQSAGIRMAVDMLPEAEAYLFLAGDQPLISEKSLQSMIDAYRQREPDILSAEWQGKRTLPALFARSMISALRSLNGDMGGRALIECGCYNVEYLELREEQEQWDIDTPDDLYNVEKWFDARVRTGNDDEKTT